MIEGENKRVHASAGGSYIKMPGCTSYSCSTLRIFMYLPPSEFLESVGFGLSVAVLQILGRLDKPSECVLEV